MTNSKLEELWDGYLIAQ
ncbi:hypothetical protein JAZ75_07875 [Sphingobacterium sp. UDSM-2020]|nr:hypothetical protein JAZ75_07875 [Sphingobacterium sp. UDSM-2020]